nr:hypothetical protein [Portibacter lacus]
MYKKYWPKSDFKRIAVAGGSGFDIYKIASQSKTNKNLFNVGSYKKTIGYAGWAFGKTNSQHNIKIIKAQFKDDFEKELAWRKKKEKEMESILRSAIEQNPEYLFILKKHPKENSVNDLTDLQNEMSSLESYPNVIYLKDETYALYEIIGSCDVWTCFESTTILEAWLMGIPTINIKPNNENKYETTIANGSLKAIDALSFNELINKLSNSELEELFKEDALLNYREKIIKDSIGFSDGLNHLRIVKELMKSFEKKRHPKYSLSKMNFYHKFLMTSMKTLTKSKFFLKFAIVKKHYFLFHTFDIDRLNKNLTKYYELIDSFYNQEKQEIENLMSYETI